MPSAPLHEVTHTLYHLSTLSASGVLLALSILQFATSMLLAQGLLRWCAHPLEPQRPLRQSDPRWGEVTIIILNSVIAIVGWLTVKTQTHGTYRRPSSTLF